jgi:hypothetical protein
MPAADPNIAVFPVTVEHEELAGSPKEYGDRKSFTAVRNLKCLWADRHELLEQLLGAHQITINDVPYYFGQEYPYRTQVYAMRGRMKPFFDSEVDADDTEGRVASYTHAELEIEYEPAVLTEIAQESLANSCEFIELPNTQLYWVNSGQTSANQLAVTEAPGRIIRMQEWSYAIKEIRDIPQTWYDFAGCVNQAALYSEKLKRTYEAETLLFHGVEPRRLIPLLGEPSWEPTLKCSWKPDGWNKFYRNGMDAPQPVYKAGGAQYKPYTPQDFLLLNLPGVVAP